MNEGLVFSSPLRIYYDDREELQRFTKTKKAIDTYAKSHPFAWFLSSKKDHLLFSFNSKYKIDAREAGRQLLKIARILRDNRYYWSSVVAIESREEEEIGAFYFEVLPDSARVKVILIDQVGNVNTISLLKRFS